MDRNTFNKYLRRLLIVSIISLALVFIFSELAFLFLTDKAENRSPTTITLVIPEGTAKKIEAGQSEPTIPTEMTFVLGDVLEVRNEDVVVHKLGPLYIPPGSSATLPLNEADNFSLGCSFQKNNYLGVEVRKPTTIWTRFTAMLTAGPPTILFFYLNSLLFYPIKSSQKEKPQP